MKKSTPKRARETRKPPTKTARVAPAVDDVGEVFMPDVPVTKPVTVEDVGEVFVPEKYAYRPLPRFKLAFDYYPIGRPDADDHWTCPYNCPGTKAIVPNLVAHTWDCPYWDNEGKEETPFDLPAFGGRERDRHGEDREEVTQGAEPQPVRVTKKPRPRRRR